MPFFVQKLVLDEKDKIREKENDVHHFLNLNENVKKIEKKMINIIEQTKNHLVKRNNYAAFGENPELFIENFIMQQNKLLKIVKNRDLNCAIQPKMDEKTMMYKIMHDNEELAKREIKNYLGKTYIN